MPVRKINHEGHEGTRREMQRETCWDMRCGLDFDSQNLTE
jgi:hypothetical protein